MCRSADLITIVSPRGRQSVKSEAAKSQHGSHLYTRRSRADQVARAVGALRRGFVCVGFRVAGCGLRVESFGIRAYGSGFGGSVLGFRCLGLDFRVYISGGHSMVKVLMKVETTWSGEQFNSWIL